MQNRQRERRGFTRARLRRSHDILSRHRQRNGLSLNGGRDRVARVDHGLQKRRVQPDFGKSWRCHGGRISWLCSGSQVV